jgi:NAD(P)-dependent dehydrogenase (short-subunit alcohol dehydrogenase family)
MQAMDLELTNSVILITGGTDGLGAALADGLVREGARVAACGRDLERVRSTQERLGSVGGDAIVIPADVTVPADLERLVDAVTERWGRIDGVVNNAGRPSGGTLEAVPDDEWAYDFELKVMAAVRLIRLALPHLRASGGGSIVNTLNTSSKAPGAGSLPTAASRAAGLAITKSLSKELAPDNVRVNAVLVGLIDSGQSRRRAAAAGVPVEEIHARQAANIPLGRVGKGSDYADLVSFLLSKRSGYITGSAVNLDGGSSPVL